MEPDGYFWISPLQVICSFGDGVDGCDERVFAWNGGGLGWKVFGNGKSTFLHLSNVIRSGLLEMRSSHPDRWMWRGQGAQIAQPLSGRRGRLKNEKNAGAVQIPSFPSFQIALPSLSVFAVI
jgi:hypothetical protein